MTDLLSIIIIMRGYTQKNNKKQYGLLLPITLINCLVHWTTLCDVHYNWQNNFTENLLLNFKVIISPVTFVYSKLLNSSSNFQGVQISTLFLAKTRIFRAAKSRWMSRLFSRYAMPSAICNARSHSRLTVNMWPSSWSCRQSSSVCIGANSVTYTAISTCSRNNFPRHCHKYK